MRYANNVIINRYDIYQLIVEKTVDLSKNNTIKTNADWNTATDPERRVDLNQMTGHYAIMPTLSQITKRQR